MQEESTKRVCKRCLFREYDRETYERDLERVLRLMDRDVKAPDALYEERLAVCKECEKLSEGTCLGCGCYVELRAAVAKNRCPYQYWKH